MPNIELSVGEAVVITFKDTDGEITVAFTDRNNYICVGCRAPVARRACELGGIVVHADMPDRAGRGDVIYHEGCDAPDLDEVGNPKKPHLA